MKLTSKTRRNILKMGVAAGTAAAFGSVLSRGARAQKLDTINIAASPFINQSVVFLPKELGWYSKVGLDPQIRTFPDGALVVAPMIAGDVDLGVVTCSAGLFNSLSRGAAMKSVLCTGQAQQGRGGTAILVRTDLYEAGIKTLADLKALKGKTVAVGAAGSINQFSMSKALAAAGLNPLTDVTWQTTVTQPDIVKQLGQKQVDAAELTYFLAFLAQRQGSAKIIASRDDSAPGSQVSMVAARDEFVAKQRDLLIRYAMAHIHAARLFNKVAADPEKNRATVELITKNIFVKDITLLNAIAPHWEYIAEGAPNEASVLAQQDFWSDTFKMVERKVPATRILDASIAAEAIKRLDAEKPFG
jgi:NitT/TauT family transport system substrate-binding protein